MFDNYGNLKTYSGKSMITLDLIYPIFAIISFYIYLVIKTIMR